MAVGIMALVATAGTAKAASVTPTPFDDNLTCKTLLDNEAAFEIKVDPPTSGTYGPITVTFSADGKLVDFTSTVPVLGVFVKGGNEGGNFYDYRPGGSPGDTDLQTPTQQEISHVSFCWDEEPTPPDDALTVTKTAEATYDRTITWDLTKTVDPASHSGTAGDSFNSTWSVEATKSVVENNYEVTGEITITNPNSQSVGFSVTDKLDDQTMAEVDCDPNMVGNQPSGTVPADGTATCTYTALPTTKDATSNNVQVSSNNPDVPGASALAPVTWQENVTGDEEVTLADERFDYSQTISDTKTETFPDTFECPSDPTKYTDGSLTTEYKNVATLTGSNTNLSKDATVTVNCTLPALSAEKTANGTFDRTITWDLTKTVDPASHSGTAGDSFNSTWSVEATKSVVEDNYEVTGEITVTNSAPIDQTFNVSDELDDGTMASVDCDSATAGDQNSATVPANGSATCTYTASPTKDATENTATVTAAGNQDVVATAPVSYTANVVGDEEVTLADERFDYSQTISDTKTETFPDTFECPSDPAEYTDGKKSFNEENVATLKGDNTDLSRNATVTVECTLPALSAEKTANGSFDRTITWDLTKTVGPQNTFSGLAGDSFNATWNVEATKSVVEDNYKVTGEITITNSAAIDQTFSVSDELDDGTVADVTCPNDTVPAKDSVTCTYTASTADATENTATVTAAGNQDVVATAPVSYTANAKGDESVTLADPRFSYSQLISGNTTKTFPETFKCPTNRSAYNSNYLYTKTFTNTATLKGPNTNLSKSATVTLNCRYPWQSETATGAGTRYPGTSNWFMYTAFTTNKVDLIAGQRYDAGDIFMTRSGSNTYIKVTLHNGFRWANMRENLKIQDFAKAPTKYVQPGNFKYKFTVTPQSTVTYTAKVPGTTALFYGIHADVERFVN